MISSSNTSCPKEVNGEMKDQQEKDEIIEFCLKHDLIKKTACGVVIKKEFFELLDIYNE
jgi:hypothetical protein